MSDSEKHEYGVVRIVDPDAMFRTTLARRLSASGFDVDTFTCGAQLLARMSGDARGCVVTELQMPGLGGLELQTAFAQLARAMPFVFLTAHGDVQSAVVAMKRGAVDFLHKSAPIDQLIAAVERALQRDQLARIVRERQDQLRQRLAELTERQEQVLRHLVRGRVNKQIAAELGIDVRTVKSHRTAITRSVGVRSIAELTTLVWESDFLAKEESPWG